MSTERRPMFDWSGIAAELDLTDSDIYRPSAATLAELNAPVVVPVPVEAPAPRPARKRRSREEVRAWKEERQLERELKRRDRFRAAIEKEERRTRAAIRREKRARALEAAAAAEADMKRPPVPAVAWCLRCGALVDAARIAEPVDFWGNGVCLNCEFSEEVKP